MYIPHIMHHKLTFQDDIYRIRGHIKKEIGQLTLSSINAHDLTSFHNKIKALNDNELDLVCGGAVKQTSEENVIQSGASGAVGAGSMFPNGSDDDRYPTKL